MKKLYYFLIISIFISSCDNDDTETTKQEEFTSIQELITSAENGDNQFKNKTLKIKANFKIGHPLTDCLADCALSFPVKYLPKKESFLFQDFNICGNREHVIIDNVGNKVSIKNIPKYSIKDSYLENTDKDSLLQIIPNLTIEATVEYDEAIDGCASTKHPSLKVILTEEQINTIYNQIENINLLE